MDVPNGVILPKEVAKLFESFPSREDVQKACKEADSTLDMMKDVITKIQASLKSFAGQGTCDSAYELYELNKAYDYASQMMIQTICAIQSTHAVHHMHLSRGVSPSDYYIQAMPVAHQYYHERVDEAATTMAMKRAEEKAEAIMGSIFGGGKPN